VSTFVETKTDIHIDSTHNELPRIFEVIALLPGAWKQQDLFSYMRQVIKVTGSPDEEYTPNQ
jgi:hypothetical protein